MATNFKKLVLGNAGTKGMGNPMKKVATKKAHNPWRRRKGNWGDTPPPPQLDAQGVPILKKIPMVDISDWFWK
jgi:hypothetical protein